MILYEGPSRIDGSPIVVIATGLSRGSKNVKTGDVVQTFIIRADVDPCEASRRSLDGAICGTCPHRRSLGGACYVTLHQAPLSVFRAYKRGSYQRASLSELPSLFEGLTVRLGSYGDPCAIPAAYLRAIASKAKATLGYTHGWRKGGETLRSLCMASCDSPEEASRAQSRGWRTFRVRLEGESLLPREYVCPASEEGGHRTTCAKCKACNGAGPKPSPCIIAHGSLASRFASIRAA